MLEAWREFLKGKRSRTDAQEFARDLTRNIFELHRDLARGVYCHGGYEHFKISDPKPRDIHKASVRDRVLHRAIYRVLYPFFDRSFIADSYSCRLDKGAHSAMERFLLFGRRASRNYADTAWVLQCDIRKFFASVDHEALHATLRRRINDERVLELLQVVLSSFNSGAPGKGLPLGNLTSQLLVNIYLNEFDQFVKHSLKVRLYLRYADDFAILSSDRRALERMLPHLERFLREELALELHPNKVFIKTVASGIDFLGWVHFPTHRVLRGTTKRRMFRNIKEKGARHETVQSYLGLLSHGNAHRLARVVESFKVA